MTDNFLPEFQLAETQGAGRNKLRCQVRGYDVPATPEERVRQRVLHWLINTKSWEKARLELERAYRWESDPNRSHIRPDIELLDEDGNVVVVVECKREEVPLSEAVGDQAKEYAIKSGAPYIWITNGNQHGFMEYIDGGWQTVGSIEPLGEEYEPPTGRVPFPDLHDEADVKNYLEEMLGAYATDDKWVSAGERKFTLALYKAIFDELDEQGGDSLPYSYDGVHLLEYCGVAYHHFTNASGGRYHTRYADFVAATRGRVEAISVAVNTWLTGNGGIRLCVSASKADRKHHALQLDVAKNCVWREERRCWDVYHNGAMSHVKNSIVLDAVRESGCGHWITNEKHKERVYLGELPEAEAVTWENTRAFVANLLHYGIIRTNLREAQAARKA